MVVLNFPTTAREDELSSQQPSSSKWESNLYKEEFWLGILGIYLVKLWDSKLQVEEN